MDEGRKTAGGDRGRWQFAWIVTAACALLTAAGLLGGDGVLAGSDVVSAAYDRVFSQAVALLDLVTGKEITNFLLGVVLILIALARNLLKRRKLLSGRLLYVGCVQFLCTTIADFAKPPFGRLRPFQALANGQWSDHWFMGADYGSFPSGHAAFYAGLFLPLALLFPRWAAPLLAIPVLVGAERVLSNDHYMSDVGASFLLAAMLSAILWKPLGRDRILMQGPFGDAARARSLHRLA